VLAVGLFANGDYGRDFGGLPGTVKGILPVSSLSGLRFFSHDGLLQLAAQLISVAVLIVTGFVISFALFKLTNLIVPLRVSREAELQGLDIPETGALGYPDFELKTTMSATHLSSYSGSQR
jgi:Amt family ammonium transporter